MRVLRPDRGSASNPLVLTAFLQAASRRRSFIGTLRYLGALGLFFLAIVDSLPLPTFAGPDILTAVLAARHRNPWYEYAAVAAAGSLIGAYITFRIAKKAGMAFVESKFRRGRVPYFMKLFRRRATGALVASTAIPFPFPTSLLFAAAGASDYNLRKFLTLVALCRLFRYALVALVAERYGRYFIRLLRHPTRDWGWLLLLFTIAAAIVAAWILATGRSRNESGAEVARRGN